jgi:hypothetical protein
VSLIFSNDPNVYFFVSALADNVLCAPVYIYISKKEKKRRGKRGQRLTFDYLPSLSNSSIFFIPLSSLSKK